MPLESGVQKMSAKPGLVNGFGVFFWAAGKKALFDRKF